MSTSVNRSFLNSLVLTIRGQLRLGDWFIELTPDPEQRDAHVVIEREHQRADIRFNPEAENLPHLIAHEMVHVLLADMDFIAMNGRSIEVMELYNLQEERVCNKLASILANLDT